MYPFDIQKNKPKGFPSIKKEPVFNSKTDLQLEKPKKIKNLKELGYSKKEIESSNFAIPCRQFAKGVYVISINSSLLSEKKVLIIQ